MPNYQPLTEEEKKQAKEKFDFLFEKLNIYFKNSENDINLNYEAELKKFNERLEDPKMIKMYRLAHEIEETIKAKKAAAKEAEEAIVGPNNKLDLKYDFLSRYVNYLMKTDGSEESKKYNINLLKEYSKDPMAYTRKNLCDILKFDPTELVNCGEDKMKIMEFYKNNMALSLATQDFFTLAGSIKPEISSEVKQKLENINEILGYVNKVSDSYKEALSLEFFAYPLFNPDLSHELFRASTKIFGVRKATKEQLNVLKYRGIESLKMNKSLSTFTAKMKAKGLVVDKDLLLKYKAIETNPRTKEVKEVRLSKYLNGDPNVKVMLRNPDEINRISKLVSKEYTDKVYNYFIKEYKEKNHKDEFSYNEVEKEMKGSLFARIFRRPSKEFKDYMSALKAYNNPKDPDYMNKDRLCNTGIAYLKHVEANGGLNEENMNDTRKMRFNLVKNTVETVTKMERIENKIFDELYGNDNIKELAVDEKEVNMDYAIDNNIELNTAKLDISKEQIEDLSN